MFIPMIILASNLLCFLNTVQADQTKSILNFVKDSKKESTHDSSMFETPTPPEKINIEKYEPSQQLIEEDPILVEEEVSHIPQITPETTSLIEKAKKEIENEEKFRFNFEDATLENVVTYVEQLFKLKFLSDDALKPMTAGGGPLQGQKITFKTNKPLSRNEAWNLFVRILDLAQLNITPGPAKNIYRITSIANAIKDPFDTYFNVSVDKLPEDSRRIRFVYIVQNAPMQTIVNIIESLRNKNTSPSPATLFPELNAIIITDKASNIRSMMHIISEIDRSLPEAMTCVKLSHVEPDYAIKMYNDLAGIDTNQPYRYTVAQKKQPQADLFPTNVRIIPESRLNSIFLLGAKKDIDRIEHVIQTIIDVRPNLPYCPLRSITLQYMKADSVAAMLNSMIDFGKGTSETANTAAAGGMIDGQRYFKDVTIISEPAFNRLIIKASDDDFVKINEFIKKIDIQQPQVGIEILIVDVSTTTIKQWGSQVRNKIPGNVNIQTSGYPTSTTTNSSIITNSTTGTTNSNSLIGNLAALTASTSNPLGATVLTIGNAVNGVWGIFQILESYSSPKIISNPFIVTTNKTKGHFEFGSTRRVQTAIVSSGSNASLPSTSAISAKLVIDVTPHVNNNGIIALEINITIQDFDQPETASAGANGNTIDRSIITNALLRNQEVLVIGGITQDNYIDNVIKVPLLGDIPIVGNLFKTITRQYIRSNLLFFICPREIHSDETEIKDLYTKQKAESIKTTLQLTQTRAEAMDPLQNAFFSNSYYNCQGTIDEFLRDETSIELERKKRAMRPVFSKPHIDRRNPRKRLSKTEDEKKVDQENKTRESNTQQKQYEPKKRFKKKGDQA